MKPTSVPVTFDISGIFGSLQVTCLATASNSVNIGSINGEWKACDTCNFLVLIPMFFKISQIVAIAPLSPEITILSGPLTAAIVTWEVYSFMASVT